MTPLRAALLPAEFVIGQAAGVTDGDDRRGAGVLKEDTNTLPQQRRRRPVAGRLQGRAYLLIQGQRQGETHKLRDGVLSCRRVQHQTHLPAS